MFADWTQIKMSRNDLRKRATCVGNVAGFEFYESPTYGDESPLLACKSSHKDKPNVWRTTFWEVPTFEELYA